MSSYLEFEGKDIDTVTQKASKKLNIPLEELSYDVISYGSTGIFGLVGTKKARIRVALPETDSISVSDNFTAEVKENDEEETLEQKDVVTEEKFKEAITIGQTVLQKIINYITAESTINVEEQSDQVLYNIKGDNAAILIGKRGQTLEAIQYIIDKIVNRNHPGRIHVLVDIEGYLENKRNNLKDQAARMAKKAKRTGKPTSFGQMNAHDRRIVHLALKNDNGVRTQSMGEGFYRKLVIFPKKKASRKKNSQ